jgi:hypothetical protein
MWGNYKLPTFRKIIPLAAQIKMERYGVLEVNALH